MFRLSQMFGLSILGLALLVGAGATQDKDKKTDKKDEKKVKDTLPPFFKNLDLTADQKKKIADVQSEYKPKTTELGKQIAELNKKMGELKKQEQQDVLKILDDTQKKKYDDEVVASKKKKEPEKKKEADKKTEK